MTEHLAIESSNMYTGVYHVLQGLIDPMSGITPGELTLRSLFQRLSNDHITEVIMALGSTIEAATTKLYLQKTLKPLGIKLTEISYGVAVGTDLEHADPVTLGHALDGRKEL
jgi:recombination protein RecR